MARAAKPKPDRLPQSPQSADDDLRTCSSAPSGPPRSLEASIGTEVRRLRKSLDLTAAELGAVGSALQ